MIKITNFKIENANAVTDDAYPSFSWSFKSDRNDVKVKEARLQVGDWTLSTTNQIAVKYAGSPLEPYSNYVANLKVITDIGEEDTTTLEFSTGHMSKSFNGKWITAGDYKFIEEKVSPVPMVFRKKFIVEKKVKTVKIYSTAIGLYNICLNGKKVGDDYFAPGFTSYKNNLQYQVYDITKDIANNNELMVTVTGGWAVGSFVFTRKNRITADRQAFLADIRIIYEDDSTEIISTNETWDVSMKGNLKLADIYDGEEYDASFNISEEYFSKASVEHVRISPKMVPSSVLVKANETFNPINIKEIGDEIIYDFGQNFAGVVELEIQGKKGQIITVRHAEILKEDGSLNTDFLRTAKAQLKYICKEGLQKYSPSFTYMGFRYISVKGISQSDIKVRAKALYSQLEEQGDFKCSNEMLNQLQSNIKWGAKSNFVEIPTDCPQRDERMGWTGDIALFAQTACFNFDMKNFLRKWLKDMRSEQLFSGGIPNTIPSQGYGFPATMPTMAIDFWGDASVLVPWALYQKTGDEKILYENYEMMKKYVKACKRWAGFFSFGKHRYIWNTPSVLHFGDWVAPDVPQMNQWQKRSKWTATASLANTSHILSMIAGILNKPEEEQYFYNIYKKTSEAYIDILTDKNGRLLEEFQTAYVLPIYFNMFDNATKNKAAANLAKLVKNGNYKIGTGFPGTPYILFALADNGQKETAFKMLLNTDCPSWLYEVKMGATTIWERWDGLDEDGKCPIGDDGTDSMISYNHYASGAVGDFLYRRVAGIEATEAGYKSFKVAPIIGGGLTSASAKVMSPYGNIYSEWNIEGGKFTIKLEVPIGTECNLILPDKKEHLLGNGMHCFSTTL